METLFLVALLLATMQAPVLAPEPGSNAARYMELIALFDESFGCTPATRPGGVVVPRYMRWRETLDRELQEIRAEIVRREGAEQIDALTRAYDFEAANVYRVAGPCDLAAAARARPGLRAGMHRLERRLGLPEGGSARRRRN